MNPKETLVAWAVDSRSSKALDRGKDQEGSEEIINHDGAIANSHLLGGRRLADQSLWGPLFIAFSRPREDDLPHEIAIAQFIFFTGQPQGAFYSFFSALLFVATSWTFVYENSSLWVGEGRIIT